MARPKKEHHETAEKILKSAQECFLVKGFGGTSINDIADKANIHKSLIYHHFGSKEDLWKAVKARIIDKSSDDASNINFKHSTLREFLEAFVTFRFKLYAEHPQMVQLMGWQRLENGSKSLEGTNNKKFTSLEAEIIVLQKLGEIRKDISPEVASYFIMSCSSNGFMDKAPFLKTKKGQEHYLKFIIESLYKILSSKN